MEINIAGAGAGKTTKMSDKIILLRNQIDAEKKIFCVAFTNSAVDCIRRKLCEHYVQIPENIIVSTIHSFLYREIIKPYYHLLYGKKYEKISIAELPQDAKYKNAKIKRLDDMNVLHQTVIPEHAKWVLCKKSKDTKNIKDGRQIIKNAIVKYCGAICIDEVQDIDKHMQEIIEELSGMEIPMILMGDPKQDLKGFKCLRNLMSIYEQNVRYISECHRCPQLHLELSNRLVDKNEKQKSEKDSGQLSVYYESEIDCHTLIERQKYDLMYISQKQGVYETHDYKKNNIRENLAEELEPLLFENHPTKDAQTVKKVAYYYAGKMIEKYRSMASLLVCSNLGHELPEIVEAIKEQADKMCFMAPAYASEPKSMLAKMLVEAAGADAYKRVFFTNGGAESNENAIKMARMVTGRTKIFSCYRSYHGATLGASNASGDWRRYAAEIGGANGFVHFMNPQMYRDGYTKGVDDAEVTKKYLDALDLQLRYEGPGNVAAILMESIVGANGVILPPDGYMEGVRALCDKYGILLICDEVMAGFYRTGKMFAFMNFDMKPDIITFAKGVTCGYVQLGGCIVSKKVAEYFEENVLQCGLTYSGHTLACAAGVAAMKYYKEHDIEGHVAEMHEIVAPFMDEMVKKHKCIGEARCIGLFGALEVVKNKETREPMQEYGVPGPVMPWIFAELKKRGFATFGRENFIEICPPLIITKEELEEYLPILDEVLTMVDEKFCD